MEINYRVEVALCDPDGFWDSYTIDVSLDDDNDGGHTEGEDED